MKRTQENEDANDDLTVMLKYQIEALAQFQVGDWAVTVRVKSRDIEVTDHKDLFFNFDIWPCRVTELYPLQTEFESITLDLNESYTYAFEGFEQVPAC